MFQKLKVFNKLYLLTTLLVLFAFLASITSVTLLNLKNHDKVEAATSSTINFQARLLTNTGALVPDGNYHVEFKLYDADTSSGSSQGSCSGDANCLWTETRTSGDLVRVVNGYLTVNLGSVDAFGTNIDWDQELWLTMNVGGTGGSPSWDGEMTPRLKLSAVPYAFKAGQLAKRTGGNTSTLDFATQTGARSILLPDESGTICLQGSSGCGFVETSDFSLQGAYDGGGTITTANNKDIAFTLDNTATDSNFLINIASGSTGRFAIQAAGNDTFSVGSTGAVISKNSTDSTSAFQIQNATGTNLLTADTANMGLTVGGDVTVGNLVSTYITDGFESGNLNLWQWDNTGVSITTNARNGKYAAEVSVNSSGEVAEAMITPGSEMYMRAYVYVDSHNTSNGASLMLMRNEDFSSYFAVYRNTAGELCIWNGVVGGGQCSGQVLPLDQWHRIELRVSVDPSGGELELFYDGAQIHSITATDTGSEDVNIIQIGSDNNEETTYYVDDVAAGPVSTGSSASLNVADSLHIGGSSTFNGKLMVQNSDGNPLFYVDPTFNSVNVGGVFETFGESFWLSNGLLWGFDDENEDPSRVVGLGSDAVFRLGTFSSEPNPYGGAGGSMYYNTSTEKFRCYQDSAWVDCISSGGGASDLQGAYDGGATITTDDNKDIAITLANTSTDSNFRINIATSSTGEFQIESNGTDVLQIGAAGQLQLDVQGSSGGILLGGDTNLYRSNTNELTTDDSLVVQGTLSVGSDINMGSSTMNLKSGGNDFFRFADSGLTVGGATFSCGLFISNDCHIQGGSSLFLRSNPSAPGSPVVGINSDSAATGGVNIGNNTGNTAINIDSGSSTIAIGTGAQARTINLGTGAATQTVTVGSTNGTSALTLQAGSTGVLVKPADSTSAFQIQNSGGTTTLFNADTTNNEIELDAATELIWGGDTSLSRAGANQLQLGQDGDLIAWNAAGDLLYFGADSDSAFIYGVTDTPGDWLFAGTVDGDSSERIIIRSDGEINWGGGSGSPDTNLYRGAANVLQTDDTFRVENVNGEALQIVNDSNAAWIESITNNGGDYLMASGLGSEGDYRFLARVDGELQWGDGTNPFDVSVSRASGGSLLLQAADTINMEADEVYIAAGTSQALVIDNVGSPTDEVYIQFASDGTPTWEIGTNAAGSSSDFYLWSDSAGNYLMRMGNTGQTRFQNSTNSTTAFQIQRASTGGTIFSVDTSTTSGSRNGIISIGTGSSSSATLFRLDLKSTSGDPTGTEGAMYYNDNSNKFRCYQNSGWTDCIAAGGSVTLQDAYNSSSSPALITTTSSAKDVIIKSGNTFNSSSVFQVQNAAGVDLFTVDSTNGGVYVGVDSGGGSVARGQLRLWGVGTNGAAARILFGDGDLSGAQNIWIGEETTGDSDALELYAKNGITLTSLNTGARVDTADNESLTLNSTDTQNYIQFEFNGSEVMEFGIQSSNQIFAWDDAAGQYIFLLDGDDGAVIQTYDSATEGLLVQREDGTEFMDAFAEVVNINGTDYDFGTLQIGDGFEGSQILLGEFGDDEWAIRMTGNAELGSDGLYIWNIDQADFALGFSGDGTAAFRSADSPLSFQIQNVSGEEIFSTDTSNDRIYIGHKTADGTGTILVLDTKNTSGDPTGVNGAMYYNSNAGKFRCYQAGSWTDCIGVGGGGSSVWQQDGTSSNLLEPISGSHTGILFGNDTSLYRASSDTLQTNSMLIVENSGTILELRDPAGTVLEVDSVGQATIYTADSGLVIQNYTGTTQETYMEFQGSDGAADWSLGSNAAGNTGDFFVYNDVAGEYALRIDSNSYVTIDNGALTINFTNNNALLVENNSGTDVFAVDTDGAGATGVTIGGGTQIEKLLHFAVDVDPANTSQDATVCATNTVTGAATSDTIIANPDPNDLTDGFAWHGARVSSSNTIQACFVKVNSGSSNPPAVTIFGIIITP